MSEQQFDTPQPVTLRVELERGALEVHAVETAVSRVVVTGRDADEVRVELTGDTLTVRGPQQRLGFLGTGTTSLQVEVTVPQESPLVVRTGSAEVRVHGPVGATQVRSGSGNVHLDSIGEAVVETGSGDVRIDAAHADLRVKCGSGDVSIGDAEGALAVSTGSGDVQIESNAASTSLKTGSGDVTISRCLADLVLATGSGDLAVGAATRGRITVKGASGDVRVGIPTGVPVWTDVTTASGRVRSDLAATGAPAEGQDHVQLRARTASGDITLARL